MKYYTSSSEFNCGIDLHSKQMYVCIMDRQGKKLIHRNIKGNDFEYFLKIAKPYLHDLTVVCECTFNWYWLSDACFAAGIQFVLAHALYLKHIHGGKNKNDRIDSEKLAHLLRANLIPPSYVYPAERRPVRALLRQRMSYVWQRSELLTHLSMNQMARGLVPAAKSGHNREIWQERILEQYKNPLHQFAASREKVSAPDPSPPKTGSPGFARAKPAFTNEWVASGLTAVCFLAAVLHCRARLRAGPERSRPGPSPIEPAWLFGWSAIAASATVD